jgi:sulfur carrier protein
MLDVRQEIARDGRHTDWHRHVAARARPDNATLAELVTALGLSGKRIAIEKNGEIVPRSLHATTSVVRGDRLETVGAVGGG